MAIKPISELHYHRYPSHLHVIPLVYLILLWHLCLSYTFYFHFAAIVILEENINNCNIQIDSIDLLLIVLFLKISDGYPLTNSYSNTACIQFHHIINNMWILLYFTFLTAEEQFNSDKFIARHKISQICSKQKFNIPFDNLNRVSSCNFLILISESTLTFNKQYSCIKLIEVYYFNIHNDSYMRKGMAMSITNTQLLH